MDIKLEAVGVDKLGIWLILGVIAIILGTLGYLEVILGYKWPRAVYLVLVIVFLAVSIGQLVVSYHRENTSKSQISELERKANVIHAIELHVSIDAITPPSEPGPKYTSVGLANVVALFSQDKTRYRFITDYQYTTQQVDATTKRMMLQYESEDPNQLLGRQINYLENVEKFVCNYSSLFKITGFATDTESYAIDINVLINGVETMNIIGKPVEKGVLSSGQAILDVSKGFAHITEAYEQQLKHRSTE